MAMNRTTPVVSLALLLGLACTSTTFGDDERGKTLFEQNCSACHGLDGTGVQGLGKDLTTSEFATKKSDKEMVAFLKEGRAADHPDNTTGVLMPPNAGNPSLTDEDLQTIVGYMRSLNKKD